MSLPATAYLPHAFDCQVLCENYAVHCTRIIVRDIPYFGIFKDTIVKHIPHAKPSKIVSFSSIHVPTIIVSIYFTGSSWPKNENKTEEMISIMEELHEYVAKDSQVPFAGDLLTGTASFIN